jgi:PAS domain S-box-containing protein
MTGTEQFFDAIFSNARANGIIIMSDGGIIDRVNAAFTTAYGYTTEDLKSKHFRILYTEKDQLTRRPEIELNTTHREGSSGDENYIVHKDGTPIWVTGEAILVKTGDTTCIAKIIHNIHAQKQLERYLMNTSELLEVLFESARSGLLILDSTLKVVRTNEPFRKLFHLAAPVAEGTKLQQIHPFWSNEELKTDLRNVLVNTIVLNKEYVADMGARDFQRMHITSKTIMSEDGSNKQLLLMVRMA